MSRLRHLTPGERRVLYKRFAPDCYWHAGELAARFEISVRQLETYFAHDLRTTPQRWLMQQRMERGAHLLLELRSVKLAAKRLGYAHVGNFIRDWHRFHEPSPLQFLLRQKGGQTSQNDNPLHL